MSIGTHSPFYGPTPVDADQCEWSVFEIVFPDDLDRYDESVLTTAYLDTKKLEVRCGFVAQMEIEYHGFPDGPHLEAVCYDHAAVIEQSNNLHRMIKSGEFDRLVREQESDA